MTWLGTYSARKTKFNILMGFRSVWRQISLNEKLGIKTNRISKGTDICTLFRNIERKREERMRMRGCVSLQNGRGSKNVWDGSETK